MSACFHSNSCSTRRLCCRTHRAVDILLARRQCIPTIFAACATGMQPAGQAATGTTVKQYFFAPAMLRSFIWFIPASIAAQCPYAVGNRRIAVTTLQVKPCSASKHLPNIEIMNFYQMSRDLLNHGDVLRLCTKAETKLH